MHWLAHALGIDTQKSWPYDFWSGAGTQLTLCAAFLAWLRHHNCHTRGCLRPGHPVPPDGSVRCRRHRP